MGVHVMRPAFNLEPKYKVTMLTREDCTLRSGPPPGNQRARLVYEWVQDEEEDRGWGLWAVLKKNAQFLSG